MSVPSKRRHLFISHHSKDDAEIAKMTNLLAGHGHDIRNSSLRVKPENEKRLNENRVDDKVIQRALKMKISWASTVVVIIGKETHKRKWVNWEIDRANEQGKRVVGVFARGGTEADIPPSFEKYGSALVNWNADSIISAIDGTNNFQNPDGSERSGPNNPGSAIC
jgi:hypothetical protein